MVMGRHKLVALVGMITLAIAGCASEETPPVATSPSPGAVAASPSAANPRATAPLATKSPGATAQPLIAQRSPAPAAVPGLIQPTNPDERTNQVKADIKASSEGRNPFAGLPPALPKTPTVSLKPVPKVAELPPGTGAPGTPAKNSGFPNSGSPTKGGNSEGSPTQPKQTIASPSIPKVQGPLGYNIPPAAPKLPPKPSTDIASAVEVTGVITVGSTPQVIVIAPGDASSRYVRVGQRISNGKVLVKRIESSAGSDPIVVLEENGVEVTKAIGEKAPTPPTQTAKPAA